MSKPGGIFQGAEYIIEAIPEALSLFVRIFDGFESRAKYGENQEQVKKGEKEVFLDERHLNFSLRNHTLDHREP